MKNWIIRHKMGLIAFIIISIILVFTIVIQINYLTQPHVLKELEVYIDTKEITSSLKTYVIILIINLIIFGVWLTLFIYIMWKIFFPTQKTLQEAFLFDSYKFLYKMPGDLKRELKRDE